ncbi:hypothetical protein [Terrabacter sp. NPDC000476]|uniref:hypothetical protein n=1 Tax=Terrabacter sp. NPDC000476 TaxID=3154258 RepID=UPI003328C962
MSDGPPTDEPTPPRAPRPPGPEGTPRAPRPVSRSRALLGLLVKVVVVVVGGWWFLRVVRQVDWAAVWAAVSGLTFAQVVALLLVVVVRQCLNAGPLAVFAPGLGLRRAVANDLSANLVATVAPPPSDVVLRLAMLRSWQVDAAAGIAGITLNTLTYYVARFGAPVLGLVIAVVTGRSEPAFAWTALTSGAISLAVVAGLAVAARGERPAARVAGWVGARLRAVVTRVDPEAWATRAATFVRGAGEALRRGAPAAMACQVGLVLSEAAMLLLALRFAGVPPEAAPGSLVVVALLVSYPLTALPLAGLGVLDAAVLTVLGLDTGPLAVSAVAGLVVFRVCWQIVPLVAGGATVALWRRAQPADHLRGATPQG